MNRILFNTIAGTPKTNTDKLTTVALCVDGETWTKTLVFNNCNTLIKTIWVNHLGKQVKEPNSELVKDSCSECNSTPIEFLDAFNVPLAVVAEYNNI
jgi:hypothetical protein